MIDRVSLSLCLPTYQSVRMTGVPHSTRLYPGVSITMFLLARLTPFEWENPHPCVDEPEELENELTLHNCFWHNWGSLMQQGSDIAPK